MIHKRILIFAAYFWPHKGGHEQYALETARRLHKNGWEIDVVTSLLPGTKLREKVDGLQVYRVPIWHLLEKTYPVPKPNSLNKLLSHLSKNKYDLVMTHTRFFPISFFGAKFAKKNKIPHLHVEHGAVHPKVKLVFSPVAQIYDHTIGAKIIRSATIVAGVSEGAEKFAKHLCKRNTILLPNAVDTKFFKKTSASNAQKASKSKLKTITFVGRLIKAKGAQDLLAATRNMAGVQLLIVGSGSYESQLRKMAGKNVHFLGEKDANGVRAALSKTDIFVNPSYSEGLPTSVLEAGSMGLPVIATDVGGTREIIDDGKNGMLIKPKDVKSLRNSIVKLLQNPNYAKTLGKRLRAKVRKQFDWGATTRKIQTLLNALTRGSND